MGCGDSSGCDVVVVVVFVALPVVAGVAAAGAVAILDAAAIIARVTIVAAVLTYLLFFLLRCFISVPSMNIMDKRIALIETQRK